MIQHPTITAAVADQRIGPSTRLRIVDLMLTGTHEPGASHHELLRAFVEQRRMKISGEYRPCYEVVV